MVNKTPSPWAEAPQTAPKEENPGIKVHLKLRSGEEGYARNMTEIHFGYKPMSFGNVKVAFESNIHSTGFTHDIDEIEEFEATPENEIAKTWWDPIQRSKI